MLMQDIGAQSSVISHPQYAKDDKAYGEYNKVKADPHFVVESPKPRN